MQVDYAYWEKQVVRKQDGGYQQKDPDPQAANPEPHTAWVHTCTRVMTRGCRKLKVCEPSGVVWGGGTSATWNNEAQARRRQCFWMVKSDP